VRAHLPPILILMPDQFRADALGCAGHPAIRTPHLDRLASEGVRFGNAFTVSPLCMPARASFASGTYPHNHGIWHNAGHLPAEDETFFHHLQAAGYHTAYIGKSHYYEHGGFHLREREPYMHARGLDDVHETTGPWATVTTDSYMTDEWHWKGLLRTFRDDYAERRKVGVSAVWPSPLPVEDHLDSYIGRKACEWIESYQDERPFCLFVGFGGPHEPWDPPGEYAALYDPAAMPEAIPPEEPPPWLSEAARVRMLRGRDLNLTPDVIGRIRANYCGKMSLIDHWIGEIRRSLEHRGWWDELLVVFWSDHGEMAGDHGRCHKSVLYESSVRVPLIVRLPGAEAAGQANEGLVEIIDVFPTLLEAAGRAPSPRALGRSLLPAIRDGAAMREAVLSEVGDTTMVRTETHKYAADASGTGLLLYDLVADPDEQLSLAGHPDHAGTERALRERLLRWLLATQCRQPWASGPEITASAG
jgi:choline-sulfatase